MLPQLCYYELLYLLPLPILLILQQPEFSIAVITVRIGGGRFALQVNERSSCTSSTQSLLTLNHQPYFPADGMVVDI
jgi:hypothetical protein